VPVTMSGAPFDAIPVGAFAGANQEVVSGHTVTLDGTGSTGPVKTYSWAQTGGPDVTLSDSTAGQPTFTAADVPADGDATLTFVLTVTGAGGPQSSTVTVHVVSSPSLPTVNAGTPQTVNQNVLVTLDGSLTTGANTYSWKQTGGTPVTLSGATTAKPTFTSPKKGGDLTFTLTATGAGGGAATTDVVVTVRNNTITPTTVIYTQSKRDWRVEGTSNVFGPGVTVTVHNGADLSGPVILTPVNVDVAGNWSVRGTGPAPTATRRISIESSGGGQQLNVPVTVK